MTGNFAISEFRLSGRHFAKMAKMAIVYFSFLPAFWVETSLPIPFIKGVSSGV
jgi:hypothetical protein